MFEVYAVIAIILLPTGFISLIYFINNNKSNKKESIWWVLIFESVATVILGGFYMYWAIILARTSAINVVNFAENNLDDLAIINDTYFDDIEVPTFYEPLGSDSSHLDKTNEIEDTRNNKNKPTASEFLHNYQYIVQNAVRKKMQNSTGEHRTFYRRMLRFAKNMEKEPQTLEEKDCFMRLFVYQALLVYSFVTCAISLLNTCHFCKRCSSPTNQSPPSQDPPKPDSSSESFGEKILDNVSVNSSQNDAPVGPLFDTDSLRSATPNLEVFNVKKMSQVNLTAPEVTRCPSAAPAVTKREKIFTAGKCLVIITLPAFFIIVLYFVMILSPDSIDALVDKLQLEIFPNFNISSDIHKANFIRNSLTNDSANNTHHNETENILKEVYAVIHKVQEEHKHSNSMPTVKGQYLYKLSLLNTTFSDITGNCITDKTSLKTFDFVVFIVLFFSVVLYTKLSAVKLKNNDASRTLSKCIFAFLILWAPSVLDVVFSTFLANREPNILSSLLMLVGNMDRLYLTAQNVNGLKKYSKSSGLIDPVSK